MTTFRLKYTHSFFDEKTGKTYIYFRRGKLRIRLHGKPHSPEFRRAYEAALKSGAPSKESVIHRVGSVGELITRYYGSPEFKNLADSSKKLYRLVLSRFGEQDGGRDVADLPLDKARKIIEEIGTKRPGMANLTRSVLLGLFEYAIACGMREERDGNPFKRIKPYKLSTHHTWTDDELKQFRKRWLIGTRERLAFAVLLYTAQRVSDAVKLKRTDVLSVTQQKTGRQLSIPVHPALARAIQASSNVVAHSGHLITNALGRQMTANALGKMMEDAIAKAGLPKHCVAHGLRKAALRRLAEHSATSKQMGAVSGHKTLRELERYTDKADQARLAAAAIALLPDEDGTEVAKQVDGLATSEQETAAAEALLKPRN